MIVVIAKMFEYHRFIEMLLIEDQGRPMIVWEGRSTKPKCNILHFCKNGLMYKFYIKVIEDSDAGFNAKLSFFLMEVSQAGLQNEHIMMIGTCGYSCQSLEEAVWNVGDSLFINKATKFDRGSISADLRLQLNPLKFMPTPELDQSFEDMREIFSSNNLWITNRHPRNIHESFLVDMESYDFITVCTTIIKQPLALIRIISDRNFGEAEEPGLNKMIRKSTSFFDAQSKFMAVLELEAPIGSSSWGNSVLSRIMIKDTTIALRVLFMQLITELDDHFNFPNSADYIMKGLHWRECDGRVLGSIPNTEICNLEDLNETISKVVNDIRANTDPGFNLTEAFGLMT